MILAVAATEFEMSLFSSLVDDDTAQRLVCGVGPVESCLKVTRYLQENRESVDMVVNFGVAGAFVGVGPQVMSLLDICIAATETLGDLGICFPMRIDDFPPDLCSSKTFNLDRHMLDLIGSVLAHAQIEYSVGNFVTVSCASGTKDRGDILRQKYDGICENMEGASIARACFEFSLPFAELRCISNMVEDRDTSKWQLKEACEKGGKIAALVVNELGKKYGKA